MGKKKVSIVPGWSDAEFQDANLGDKRLERRLMIVAEQLSKHPEAPINQAHEDWSDTKSAYRFFDNDKVKAAAILEPHRNRTVARMRQEKVIVVAQDTTSVNYNSHKKVIGLGPIGDSKHNAQGLHIHTGFACSEEGLPLGIVSQKIWSRNGYKKRSNKELARTRIEDKESFRWIELIREVSKLVTPGTKIVSVGDRESDIYELFVEALKLEAFFVARSCNDRCILGAEALHLREHLKSQAAIGEITLSIPNDAKGQKKVVAEVKFGEVCLNPPKRSGDAAAIALKPVNLFAVLVREKNPVDPANPIEWLLLTKVPVLALADALKVVSWYKCRWQIEVFHKTLKSGCTVERCRLETAARLERYLTLMSIIAWRIFWLTFVKRTSPKAPATTVLTHIELLTLHALVTKSLATPSKEFSVSQAVIEVAKLGGFLARKHDRHPGPMVIWRGWHALANAVSLWEATHHV